MQEKKSQNDTFLVFERLKSVYQLKNNTALASFFEVKPQSVSTMLKRQTIPYEIIVSKCDKKHLPFILFGIEEKTSDFSENEKKSEKNEGTDESNNEEKNHFITHLEKDVIYFREQCNFKDQQILRLQETIDMYHTGRAIVVNPKGSKS